MKKHSFFLSLLLIAALVLSACSGGAKETSASSAKATSAASAGTTAAATTAAAVPAATTAAAAEKTEQAAETTAAEEQEPEEGEDSDSDTPEMTEERFIKYFDLLLSENEIAQSDFFVEYGGRKYLYQDLGELFKAAKDAGGTIDVNLMGEAEEMLDLEIMSGYLQFMEGWDAWDVGSGSDAVSREFIDRFYGDWHGMVAFRNRTGKYVEALGGDPTNSIARFIMDEDGYVWGAFIGVHVEDTPIEDLEAELDEEKDCMYISGSWISVPFENIPVTEENGTLHFEIPISKEAGSFTMVFNLRHLNDIGWTNEDPALPQAYIEHCQGWSFDQLAEANGYTSWDYPSYSAGEEPVYPTQIAPETETEDFGKTTKEADGVVSLDTLKAAYKWLNAELDNSAHEPLTYERIRDQLGVDGKKQSPAQWTADRHKYEWCTADGKEWMDIFFSVNADGSEIFSQVNPSSGL